MLIIPAMIQTEHTLICLFLPLRFLQNPKANPVRLAGQKIQMAQANVSIADQNSLVNTVQPILKIYRLFKQ